MNAGVLYLSYDGMLEPLGQSQVLAYLKPLAADRAIHLISFEKAADWEDVPARERLAAEIAESGITWHPLRYHKTPSSIATSWDIVHGTLIGLYLVRRYNLRLLHARSYVASMMALFIKRATGAAYIFDMRGFWADERVEGGLWSPKGNLYRVAKIFERKFLLAADHVVCLTHAGVREMRRFPYVAQRMPPVTVIPTCADLTRFRPQPSPGFEHGFVLGYVGSAGTWYLFQQTADCFAQLLRIRADARLLVLNRGEHDFIRDCLTRSGVPESAVEVTECSHREVPLQMARMHAGIFFIKSSFSKQASAPTKLAEFLGCGIPCLANAGVGDMADVIEGERVGVAMEELDTVQYRAALDRLLAMVSDPTIRERCVAAAHKWFSLEEGVSRYGSIYAALRPQP